MELVNSPLDQRFATDRRPRESEAKREHALSAASLAETEHDIQRRSWRDLLLSAKERYHELKKGLMERTDQSLEAAAEQYVELPDTYSRVRRTVEAARSSMSLRNITELGIRAVLPLAEFSAQMAAKQFFVDIAVRQADYSKTVERYDGRGGVGQLEAEAVEFAEAVRQHLEVLQGFTTELPNASPEQHETFRQGRITNSLKYAEQQLQAASLIDESAKQKILADLRIHLDTVVFDPQRSSIMKAYEQISNSQQRALDGIVRKHIDVYQKRKARNLSVATTAARWLTLGVESFVVGKVASIQGAVQHEYDAALTQLPATERTTANRMLALARSTKEAFSKYVMHDKFRGLLGKHRRLEQLMDELLNGKYEAGEEFDVDGVTAKLWREFNADFEAKGITEQQLYEQVEELAYNQADRRKQLGELVRYRLLQWHKDAVKSTALQFEQVFQKVNDNVIAYGVLQHTDQLVEHAGMSIAGVEQALTQLESAVQSITVSLAQPTEPASFAMVHDSPEIESIVPAESLPGQVEDAPEPIDHLTVGPIDHVVKPGENAWGIVKQSIEGYRVRAGDPDLSINEALKQLAIDNHLTNISELKVGQHLMVPMVGKESLEGASAKEFVETVAPLEIVHSVGEYVGEAKHIDEGYRPDNFVEGVNRHNLNHLPNGEYTLVFGQRYGEGRTGNSMPVHYDSAYKVTVMGETVEIEAVGGSEKFHSVAELLTKEHSPIVRVFNDAGEYTHVPQEHMRSQDWSEYNKAMVQYLQDHPIRVVEKDGTYCAKDVAGRLSLFSHHLAADLGIDLRSGKGEVTGVTVHAPMMTEAIVASGGQELATLKEYFEVTATGSTEKAHDANYDVALKHWIQTAAESPLRVATFLFSGTHIQDIIAANREIGGEANSHAVTLLGEKDTLFTVHQDGTVARALERALGLSHADFQARGHLLEVLGVEVNGHPITNEAHWQDISLQSGDKIVVHDVALNHRFGTDVSDTLVSMMIRNESLAPVSVLEPNAAVVNEALAQPEFASIDFPVNTFVEIHKGMTFSEAMRSANVSPDVWQATAYALAERGVDVNHLRPGDLVPVYDEGALRDARDELYERAEDRLEAEQIAGVYIHLVRPHESMDHVTQQYFNRGAYSATEWSQLRDGLATAMGVPNGVREMPGDTYVKPYQVKEYHLVADQAYTVTENDIAGLDKAVWQQRASERVYIPESLPLTVDGSTVATPFPAEVRRLIDTAVDNNPEYSETVRTALSLVYANEGLREIADLTLPSQAIAWVNEHLSSRSATLDNLISKIEYISSRQAMKDAAWTIQDSPWLKATLDYTIEALKTNLGERGELVDQATYGVLGEVEETLDTIANVSSAGLFQVRANNFAPEGTREFEHLELQLREDPLLNTTAAAEMLHRGELAWDTYLSAFDDPQASDHEAKTLAILNSYNGGPYKTMLGGVQENILQFAKHEQIDTGLQVASGRDSAATQTALMAVYTHLYEQGKVTVAPEQAERDIALLGKETVGFLRSETMQQMKAGYAATMGEDFSLLPDRRHLNDADVTYANYALLATRGDALAVIQNHSRDNRVAQGQTIKSVPAG